MMRLEPVRNALPVRWWAVLLIYVLAKGLEHGDQTVFAWTDHRVSGHTLKHLVAACAAWPVIAALWRTRRHHHFLESTSQGRAPLGIR